MGCMWGLRALRCITGRAACWAKARHKCAMPTAPAAGSEWPIQLLQASRVRLGVLWLLCGGVRTAVRAPISMGSPKGVPAQIQPTPTVTKSCTITGVRHGMKVEVMMGKESTTYKQKHNSRSPIQAFLDQTLDQAFAQCCIPVPCSCVKAMSCG